METGRLIITTVLLLQVGCGNLTLSERETREACHGLHVKEGVLHLRGTPYRGMGVNYFSLFQRKIKNREDNSTQHNLARLAQSGVPFVRFMACGFWPVDWDLYQKDKQAYFKLLDEIVLCAEQNQIGLIPSLFWHMSTFPDLVGEPMDQFGNPNSKTSGFIRTYTREVVGRYKNSPAIWAWEFGNEYNLHVDLPNASTHRPPVWPKLKTAAARSERDELSSTMMLTAFQTFAQAVRELDDHRLIITGNSIPRPHAWHNTNEKSWTKDTPAQFDQILVRDNPDPYDVMSVHLYPREADKYSGCCENLHSLINLLKQLSDRHGKPLFIGEFGASQNVNAAEEQKLFMEIVDAIVFNKIPLSAMWVFDLPLQDKDWNVTFENRRAYMLDRVFEANRKL
jgi:hypothetical protein